MQSSKIKANSNSNSRKKTYFDANGEPIPGNSASHREEVQESTATENVSPNLPSSEGNIFEQSNDGKKWFEMFPKYSGKCMDTADLKESEKALLYEECERALEEEKKILEKKKKVEGSNWLHTALRKGTLHDRTNAGALLITSNPVTNLQTLATLIDFTRISQKYNKAVIMTITDLWIEILLPSTRKLYSLEFRGTYWKQLKDPNNCPSELQRRRIFAYWHFENALKDKYFEFVTNLRVILQKAQDVDKMICIVATTKLLTHGPELEEMLLKMILNKLGDPSSKVANKALHHLTKLANKHPNMCGVLVGECEKLIFRNNISDRAQRFGLCYLANIGNICQSSVCEQLVNVCFAFFKMLVQKGAVNSRTMQSILVCLEKAVAGMSEEKFKNGNILDKETETTIYRLAHFSDIQVSIQTFSLLLQLNCKNENSANDRFYNALYKKMLDSDLHFVGSKTAERFLYVVHKAMYHDQSLKRIKAFVKRLLQISFYTPSNLTAAIMMVLHDLFTSRKELEILFIPKTPKHGKSGRINQQNLISSDENNTTESSDELTSNQESPKVEAYNAFHRVPMFAGAQYAHFYELFLLRKHYHPSIKIFADNIINRNPIDYNGNPLQDFGLAQFLERFSFKNPKKNLTTKNSAENANLCRKRHTPTGSRKLPVKDLTKLNCTEDEIYIFNYLEMKRNQLHEKEKGKNEKTSNEDNNEAEEFENSTANSEVDDEEFEAFLNQYLEKKNSASTSRNKPIDQIEEIDFMKELQSQKKSNKNNNGNKDRDIDDDSNTQSDSDDMDEEDVDVSDEEEENVSGEGEEDIPNEEEDDSGEQSDLSQSEDSDDKEKYAISSESEIEDSSTDDEENGPMDSAKFSRKRRNIFKDNDDLSFGKKLKKTNDVSELFAAVDDFSEQLEDTAKIRMHGTSNATSNRDKASAKQLKWEEKRHSNFKKHYKKK